MSSASTSWYLDGDSLVEELRRGGFGPGEVPRISGFDDVREIRRGGQGVVYSAMQKSTKRRVAIKVLLEGAFASASGRRRFEREIDLAASLRHPNIVGIHDSGVTGDGRLYFVMEYVEGLPLDQHVAARFGPVAGGGGEDSGGALRSVVTSAGIGSRGRVEGLLEIFLKVCEAVSYAHQRGVIHRDLKPGNILVDADGSPHVCDFGLATTVRGSAADDSALSVLSRTGQFMGSLPWASPEQLESSRSAVDVRSDVYSLGVILYQELCGRHPFGVERGIRELFESIQKDEPSRPSAVMRGLDDDVDTIVMKCLSKDAARRYQSTAALAEDVRRYLSGEPIQARRDSTWYTLRKKVRRYQWAAVAGAVALVVLGAALWVSVRSTRAAQTEAARREAIGGFLERVLTSVDPTRDGAEVRFLEVINRAAGELRERVGREPLVEASIRRTLGSSYSGLGMYEEAEKHFREAYEICSRELGPTNRITLELRAELPAAAMALGRMEEAEEMAHSALEAVEEAFGNEDALALRVQRQWGDILNVRGKTQEAESLIRGALDSQRRLLGDGHDDTLSSMNSLAVLLKQAGKAEEAVSWFERIVSEAEKLERLGEPGMLTTMNNLALALQSLGRLDESEAMQRRTLSERRSMLGAEHPDTLINMSNLATLLIERRKLEEAEGLLREVVAIERRTLEPDSVALQTAIQNLAKVAQDSGKLKEAEKLFRESLESRLRVLGPENNMTLMTKANLAALYGTMGRSEEAIVLLREVLAVRKRVLGEEHLDTLVTENNIGMTLQKMGNLEEAAGYFESACRGAAKSLSEGHYVTALFRGNLGRCLMGLERWAEAVEPLEQACRSLEAAFGREDGRTRQNVSSLIEAAEMAGAGEKAEFWRGGEAASNEGQRGGPTSSRSE